MNDRPRAKLTELVRSGGTSLLGNPQWVHESLQAACPDCPGEVMAISAAMRQGVPASLITAASQPGTQWPEFAADWVQRLQVAEQMPPDYAAWAVDSWATALGIAISPSSSAPVQTFVPPGSPAAPPVAQPAAFQQPVATQQTGAPVPYSTPPPAGYPAGFPPAAPAKSAKAGPVALVLVLVAVAAVVVYLIVRSRFDSALTGNWQSTYVDGPIGWPRAWQISSFGDMKISETLGDTGVMVTGALDNVRVLRSTRLGIIEVFYNFQGPEKVLFSGPLLGPEGNRAWDWSTVDRGVPSPGKFTFVGTWITSAPQHGLTGSMSFAVAYDASYKLAANYSGSGKLQAKGGNYTFLSAAGATLESGTYQVSGSNQVVFRSANGQSVMTWSRSQ
jgi:hypothetical protein